MGAFQGTLNQNEIFGALYNMIISQEVFSNNIAGTFSTLVDSARVDGGLYGDTKLYYSTDALKSSSWGNDSEASNLLALHRPPAPSCQAITLNVFRQICLTLDQYLSKRAFANEGAFAQFNSVMLGWMADTKKIYDSTIYNAYIGTTKSSANKNTINVPVGDITATGEEKSRLEAQMIAQYLADLFIDMQDISRDFNDYKYLRSYDMANLKVVWNSKYVNKINKLDLPTIFNKNGLMGEKFEDIILPARYFGNVNSAQKTADGTKTRSLIEQVIGTSHYFAGDLITANEVAPAGTSYQEDDTIICKVMANNSVPYMSAFQVGTSFFNPKSLTDNHYLTFGHNTLEYLKDKPLITLVAYTTPAQTGGN